MGLEVIGHEGEGNLSLSSSAWGSLDGNALIKKSNTKDKMHKNASQLSHVFDLVMDTYHVIHAHITPWILVWRKGTHAEPLNKGLSCGEQRVNSDQKEDPQSSDGDSATWNRV